MPIDEELQTEIRAQQTRVADQWPDAHPHLFPALTGNAGGQRAMTYYSYRIMLTAWLKVCDIRDEHGDPVHLTPHQWRHTFACRLINRDVPQEVIRVLLDHESTEMTAHYARITDQTVRRRWEQGDQGQHQRRTRSPSTRTGRSPRRSGRKPVTASPPRPCRTATADCPCRKAARTPTPA